MCQADIHAAALGMTGPKSHQPQGTGWSEERGSPPPSPWPLLPEGGRQSLRPYVRGNYSKVTVLCFLKVAFLKNVDLFLYLLPETQLLHREIPITEKALETCLKAALRNEWTRSVSLLLCPT